LLKDMTKAVTRIKKAITNKEKLMIFGDFDADGTTGTTILIKTMELIEGKAEHYFPSRLTEGYGLNKKAIDNAVNNNIKLIITVDCGINANKEVSYAKKKGIDVIITDHHEPPEQLPEAKAIINPKQKECKYPYKELAGVGVAFKLAQSLIREYSISFDEFSFLDLVCLGTVADIVPLTGENRIIVKNGLKKLMKTENIGLKALIEVSDIKGKEINPGHISFRLAPRINAAGRLTSADKIMKLFQTKSETEAYTIAKFLDEQNTKRQDIQQKILDEAILKVEKEIDLDKETCIILADESWHRGVIGIVASKIVEKYHRPTILIAIEKGIGYGSGRSISNFHLFDAVDSCKDLFENYGGHTQAIGIKINKNNIEKLRKEINNYAKKMLSAEDLIPKINLDVKLKLSQVDEELIDEINKLTPFGMGNPKPVFYSTNLSLEDEPRILKEKHIRMELCDGSEIIDAIGFNMAHFYDEIMKNQEQINVVFFPELNEWNGDETMNLVLKDMKFGNQ
jgi:single-stranded-DNA-specific exonuclease